MSAYRPVVAFRGEPGTKPPQGGFCVFPSDESQRLYRRLQSLLRCGQGYALSLAKPRGNVPHVTSARPDSTDQVFYAAGSPTPVKSRSAFATRDLPPGVSYDPQSLHHLLLLPLTRHHDAV